MIQVLLFLGMTFVLMSILIGIQIKKKVDMRSLLGLMLFGFVLSLPFIMVERLGSGLRFYVVILAFVAIEVSVLFLEKHVKKFHDLIHHNVKTLRWVSYLIISIGFTFSEISFLIFSSHDTAQLISSLPSRTIFAISMHSIFTSANSLAVSEAVESATTAILQFVSYYLKLAIISTSHYLYIFFSEHNFILWMIPFVLLNIAIHFQYKKYLENKKMVLI